MEFRDRLGGNPESVMNNLNQVGRGGGGENAKKFQDDSSLML